MVEVHLEWGPRAVEVFGGWADVVVVVDVLSFSTAVDVAVSRGAAVVPCAVDRAEAERLGAQLGAQVAVLRRKTSPVRPYSLSPVSLASLPANSTVVLPSPNGAALTARLVWTDLTVVAGCLRNAAAVGAHVASVGSRVGVLAAGERWPHDDSLRPAFEDFVGAGAVIASIAGARRTPEAETATAAYLDARDDLEQRLSECVSGRELTERGYDIDVTWAAAVNTSHTVPVLVDGKYVSAPSEGPTPEQVVGHEPDGIDGA